MTLTAMKWACTRTCFDKQVALTISQPPDLGIGAILKRQLTGKPAPAGSEDRVHRSLGRDAGFWPIHRWNFVHRVMPTIRRAAAARASTRWGCWRRRRSRRGGSAHAAHRRRFLESQHFSASKPARNGRGRARRGHRRISKRRGRRRGAPHFGPTGRSRKVRRFCANLLKTSPRYRDAIAAGGHAQAYIHSIGRSGYANRSRVRE